MTAATDIPRYLIAAPLREHPVRASRVIPDALVIRTPAGFLVGVNPDDPRAVVKRAVRAQMGPVLAWLANPPSTRTGEDVLAALQEACG